MRLLVFSTLFPHPGAPHHGIFVWERLRAYLRRIGGEAVVVAPVPYVPSALARGPYAAYRDVPDEEQRDGVLVLHPRYPLIPKLSMSIAPLALAWSGVRAVRRLRRQGWDFDLVDAHYLYPDAVAAAFVARRFSWPLVVTARGTDVNLLPRYRVPRAWLRWMLRRARAAITVAAALREDLTLLAPTGLPVHVLRHGVDLDKFQPLPRAETRRALGWDGAARILLSVGHLIERKGHHHVLAALPRLDEDVQLKIIGSGPWEGRLRAQVRQLGVGGRVEFCGPWPHERLREAYSAADLLVLLSSREGWPNVLLESMASGTRVVASRVFGSPEVVRDPVVGELVDGTEPDAVAQALRNQLTRREDRPAVRRFAERHSWDETVDGMRDVFEQARRR